MYLCKHNGEAEDRQIYKEILLEGLLCHYISMDFPTIEPFVTIL